MEPSVRVMTTTQQWAETITAKVQTIAGQLGVKGYKLADVNSATPERLQSLSGIGALDAKKIVEGRPYQRASDLVTKHILSQDTYNEMKDQIEVKQP